MTKETAPVPATTKGLIGVTTLGAAEGAAIGWFAGGPGGAIVMGSIGGATACGSELTRRAITSSRNKREKSALMQPETNTQTQAAEVIAQENGSVDISIDLTSSTRRTDIAQEETEAVVKSDSQQMTNIPLSELPSALASLRAHMHAGSMPAWRTTISEKIVASTQNAAAYDHVPRRSA